jgi:hypothetical protein
VNTSNGKKNVGKKSIKTNEKMTACRLWPDGKLN